MKTRNFFAGAVQFSIAALFAFSMSSCKHDSNDSTPTDYLGNWVTEQTISTENGDVQVRDLLSFTETGFTEVAKIEDTISNTWIDYIGRKGKITVHKGGIDVTLTDAGITAFDLDGNPTGVITYYADGTAEFTQILALFEMSKIYKAQYSVTGNSLTLKADNNNNGSYDDEDEVHVFTKQ